MLFTQNEHHIGPMMLHTTPISDWVCKLRVFQNCFINNNNNTKH